MDEDAQMAMDLALDALNGERAVLQHPDLPVELRIPRAMWDQLARPGGLRVTLTVVPA